MLVDLGSPILEGRDIDDGVKYLNALIFRREGEISDRELRRDRKATGQEQSGGGSHFWDTSSRPKWAAFAPAHPSAPTHYTANVPKGGPTILQRSVYSIGTKKSEASRSAQSQFQDHPLNARGDEADGIIKITTVSNQKLGPPPTRSSSAWGQIFGEAKARPACSCAHKSDL